MEPEPTLAPTAPDALDEAPLVRPASDGAPGVAAPSLLPSAEPSTTDLAGQAVAAAAVLAAAGSAYREAAAAAPGTEALVSAPADAPAADEDDEPQRVKTYAERREELRVQRTVRAALGGLFTGKTPGELTTEEQELKCQAVVQALSGPERPMLLEQLVRNLCRKPKAKDKLSKRAGKRMAALLAPAIKLRYGETPEKLQDGLQAMVDEALGRDQASVIVLTKKAKADVERDMTKVLLEHSGMTVSKWRKTRSELKPHFSRVGGIEFVKSWVYADAVRNDDPNLPRPEPCIRGQGADRVRNEGGEVKIAQAPARLGYADGRGNRGRGGGGSGRKGRRADALASPAPVVSPQQAMQAAAQPLAPMAPMAPHGTWPALPPTTSRPGPGWPLQSPTPNYLPPGAFRGW